MANTGAPKSAVSVLSKQLANSIGVEGQVISEASNKSSGKPTVIT